MGTKKVMRAIEEGLDNTNLESEILLFMHRLPNLNLKDKQII